MSFLLLPDIYQAQILDNLAMYKFHGILSDHYTIL